MKPQQYRIAFHSFYMRWMILTPRGRIDSMWQNEQTAIYKAFELNHPPEHQA